VAFSPDGARVVSGGDNHALRLWDTRSGRQIGAPLAGHKGDVMSVAFSADGQRIVSGSADDTLRLWDARSGQPIGAPLKGHKDTVTVATSSNDLNLALSKAEGATLRLRSDGDVDSIGVSIAPAASGLPAGRLVLAKDANGIFKLPPALTGRTFKINTYKYAPLTISKWDGAPLELQLQRVAGK
jgi:WD40 repeat protein